MSLVPFSGRRPTSTHPDALQTAQSLGRLARQLYNWYSASGSSPKTNVGMPRSRGIKGGRGRGGSSGVNPQNSSDLAVNPPTHNIPAVVPKLVSNRLAWDVVKVDFTLTPSTGGIVELNFSAALTDHPQASAWAQLFDQWCIPQFSVTFRSLESPGGTQSISILYTALDFDSVGTLGSIPAIEDYATCRLDTMTTGSTVTRSVRPCVKISTGQVPGSGTNVNASLDRVWQDSGATGTPWLGIRSMVSASNSSAITCTKTIWFAFRNQI